MKMAEETPRLDETSPVEEWAEALTQGNRRALSRLLTYAESSKESHQNLVDSVLASSVDTGAFRIALTGAPGVGKSTLLEALGLHLVASGLRVAVLPIDPSSPVTGGSLLADKTRMTRLAAQEAAFIRPIPSGASLGGVSPRAQKCVALCARADFDVIFVETVGVGQSELDAWSLVDCLVLLVSPGAGDEMQGLKRGLMEHIDLLAITKADLSPEWARRTLSNYESALSLLRRADPPDSLLLDGVTGLGVDTLWTRLLSFRERLTGTDRANRALAQNERLFWRELCATIKFHVTEQTRLEPQGEVALLLDGCRRGDLSASDACRQLLSLLRRAP
jgi:LAO/AO transport system kinase